MAQFKNIEVTARAERRAAEVLLEDAAETSNPVVRGSMGRAFYARVQLDESDARDLYAKLGELIAGWDA